MNINIIASNCTEKNNEYIFSLLKNRDKSKNHIIIAPDRSQFSIEQRLFDETGEKCFFDVNVISLSRLSKQVIKNNRKNILTKQSGVALVKKILKDNKSNLSVFSKAINYMGFADTLFKTICFYKSCFIPCEQVYVTDSKSYSNLKQKDIKLVYSEYEKYLQNDFTDSFNQLKVFADMINADTFKNTIFYFVEFDDFTRLMYEVIVKLARFSEGIYLACQYGKDSNNSNIYNNKVYYDLVDLFKQEGFNYTINKLQGFDIATKQLLSNNLLSYSPEKIDLSSSGVSVKCFNNVNDEVKFVLAEIYSKVVKEKLNLSNFAIVVPSLSIYKNVLDKELIKYNMPYYIDESEVAVDNTIIRLLFDVVKLLTKDYRYFDFSVVLKSPVLNFEINSVCEYDNYLRRIGAISDMCLRDDKTESDEIKQLISLIKGWRECTENIGTYSDFVTLMQSIYQYIISRSENYVTSLDAIGKRVFTQVNNKFDNINRDMLSVFGNTEVAFDEFVDIYRAYFEASSISMPPITSDTLFIADFENSYINKFDYLYILGNNEGILPSQKLDNGLLTDDELKKLPNANKLTPTVAMLNARKVVKLYDLVFKYNKTLSLSYVNGNAEGKLYPNNLVQSFVKIGDLPVVSCSHVLDVLNSNYESLGNDNVLFNNQTQKLASENLINYLNTWDTYNSCVPYRELCSSLYNVLDNKNKMLVDKIGVSNTIANLTEDNLFLSTGRTSISQIETFNRCPYVHYARYGLKLSDNQNTKIKPNQIGTIIHEVLSSIVPLIVANKDYCDDKIKEIARGQLDSVLKKDEFKEMVENIDNAYVIKALYRELDRIVIAVIREIKFSNFEPTYYEYKFDKTLNINGIDIKGYIDRIDTKEDGFIILDYKTGDNQFKNYNDVYSGKKLQLLVYAKAFEMNSKKKAKGVFYFPISNSFGDDKSYRLNGVMLKSDENIVDIDSNMVEPEYVSPIVNLQLTSKGSIKNSDYYKNMCISAEDFDYLLNFAITQVSKTIDKIMLGDINPYPLCDAGKSVCDYCEFKAMCNYQHDNDHDVVAVENMNKLKELNE